MHLTCLPQCLAHSRDLDIDTVFVNLKNKWQGKVAERPCSPLGHVPRERGVMVANTTGNINPQAHSHKHCP